MAYVHSICVPLLLILVFIQRACAHYNLAHPPPYNTGTCNRRHGCGPCPRAYSSPEHSANTVWARGSLVNITWHRNNHKDGMYRRSLVPVSQMMNTDAHTRFAFNWGCWSQGEVKCRPKEHRQGFCGSDKNRLVYTNLMTVPDVFPDGQYVFAMVWFGGSGRTRIPPINAARFSNFAACSYVTIRGGKKLSQSYQRTFTQGIQNERDNVDDQKLKPNSQCWSTSDRVNQCGGVNCTGVKVQPMTPFEFRNGAPPPLFGSEIAAAQAPPSTFSLLNASQQQPHPQKQAANSSQASNLSSSSSSSPKVTPSQQSTTTAPQIPASSTPSTIAPQNSLESHSTNSLSTTTTQQAPTSTHRWSIGEKRWTSQCGLYKPCMQYCEQNAQACTNVLELARKLQQLELGDAQATTA